MAPALLAQPEFVEAIAGLLYRELADRVQAEDAKHAGRDTGRQRAVLRNMGVPWHRRSDAVQQVWLEAVQAVMVYFTSTDKTWERGIPARRLQGIAPLEDDAL